MPLISVLMPAYNREIDVAEAIRSVQNQTVEDWELLILDDASTDKTRDVCRAFEAEDKRIRVIVNERNLGCGKCRNRLVLEAIGKYIAIQDSDDVSAPQRFAREMDILDSKPEIDLVSGIATWIDVEDGKVLLHYPPHLFHGRQYPQDRNELVRLLYLDCEAAITTCMFRRSLLEKITEPFGKYRFVDDWYFFLQLAHRFRMWGIPEALVTMKRGLNHDHLWSDYDAAIKEARKMKRELYQYYKNDPDSPIDDSLYRKSVAAVLKAQSKYSPTWRKFPTAVQAILWNPSYLWNFFGQALRRGKRLVRKPLMNKPVSENRRIL